MAFLPLAGRKPGGPSPRARSRCTAATSKTLLKPGEKRFGYVPLLGDNVEIDDEGASVVLVFTREALAGGVVDSFEEVDSPLARYADIFVRRHYAPTYSAIDESLAQPLKSATISAGQYHGVVRAKFVSWLLQSGFAIDSFESIDEDEIFLKISLDREGKVIRQLAQQQEYRMPYAEVAYEVAEPVGNFAGHEPMENDLGMPTLGYQAYHTDIDQSMGPFRPVDEIRIIEHRLEQWVSLSEMQEQGVISKFFVGADYDAAMELNEQWANPWRFFMIPRTHDQTLVREYFGERIAFFFVFFAKFIQWLVPLAVSGLLCYLRLLPLLDLTMRSQKIIGLTFAGFMVTWGSLFVKCFRNHALRLQQLWGMKDYDQVSPQLLSYDPDLEGTDRHKVMRIVPDVAMVIFCLLFCSILFTLELAMKYSKEAGHALPFGTMLVGLLMQASSFAWGSLAPKLVDLQNHRTQARRDNELTRILASVKLFIALWPFVHLAFVKNWTNPTCASSLGAAAVQAYYPRGYTAASPNLWPVGTDVEVNFSEEAGEVLSITGLEWLEAFSYQRNNGDTCIYGCVPIHCTLHPQGAVCTTNCEHELESALPTFFAMHMATTFVFLLIPILLTGYFVRQEIAKAGQLRRARTEDPEDGCPCPCAQSDWGRYSFLQLQAKRWDQASYEYKSWGGSYTEDFLELAVGFALITCFGLLVPRLAAFALVGYLVEYRLLAYRMTNVTCRPTPMGSEGIGMWQEVFEAISMVAMVCNIGLVVMVMPPMAEWSREAKTQTVLVMQVVLIILRVVVRSFIPAEPLDVKRVDDFNTHFRSHIVKHPPLVIPAAENFAQRIRDISLSFGVGGGSPCAQSGRATGPWL